MLIAAPFTRRRRLALAASLLVIVAGCGAPRADRQAIAARYTTWQAALSERRMEDGYALMSPAFRAGHSPAEFDALFRGITEDFPTLPRRFELRFEGSGEGALAYLYPFQNEWMQFRDGVELEWQRVAGEWYLTGELEYFRD